MGDPIRGGCTHLELSGRTRTATLTADAMTGCVPDQREELRPDPQAQLRGRLNRMPVASGQSERLSSPCRPGSEEQLSDSPRWCLYT